MSIHISSSKQVLPSQRSVCDNYSTSIPENTVNVLSTVLPVPNVGSSPEKDNSIKAPVWQGDKIVEIPLQLFAWGRVDFGKSSYSLSADFLYHHVARLAEKRMQRRKTLPSHGYSRPVYVVERLMSRA